MPITQIQAYHLSLLAYFQPYKDTQTMEDLIVQILLDEQLQQDYENNEMFKHNLDQVKNIYPKDYKDFKIEKFYDDNKVSGLVYYLLRYQDTCVYAIRGSEELDAIHHTTKWQDWNDNFHMFLHGPTYQQIKILDCFYEDVKDGDIYVCGHSKGGNLALFIALASREEEFQRMQKVIVFNSPGITTSVMETYHERLMSSDFIEKIVLYENEHDTISQFYGHIKEPIIVQSKTANNNMSQVFHNHNLYSMAFDSDDFILASHKSAIPKMVHYFVNDYFAKLPQKKLHIIVERMDDYFQSDLAMNDLYRVLIYQISKYTNLFEDLSYDEIKTITFHDLIEKRKSRILLQKILDTAPKIKGFDMHLIESVIIENYEVYVQEKAEQMQKLLKDNNAYLISKIKNIKTKKINIAKKEIM